MSESSRASGFHEFSPPPSPDENALVFLDASALLVPYDAGASSLRDITTLYSRLKSAGRLRVPAQAAREYVANRAKKVGELYKLLGDRMSALATPRLDFPFLEEIPAYKELKAIEDRLLAVANESRVAWKKLRDLVQGWSRSDPVRDAYDGVFGNDVIVDLETASTDIEKVRVERYEQKQPPGYKDAAKDDGGVGDLIIWLTILQEAAKTQRAVVLVSGEMKADWFHRSGKTPLFPRYELLDEFRRVSGGRGFDILSLSALLQASGAPAEAVEDVKRSEKRTRHLTPAVTDPIAGLALDYLQPFVRFTSVQESAPDIYAMNTEGEKPTGLFIVNLDTRFQPAANAAETPAGGHLGAGGRYGIDSYFTFGRELVDKSEIAAMRAVRTGLFREAILFCVATDRAVARRLSDRYAEQRFPELRPVVAHYDGAKLQILWQPFAAQGQ